MIDISEFPDFSDLPDISEGDPLESSVSKSAAKIVVRNSFKKMCSFLFK